MLNAQSEVCSSQAVANKLYVVLSNTFPYVHRNYTKVIFYHTRKLFSFPRTDLFVNVMHPCMLVSFRSSCITRTRTTTRATSSSCVARGACCGATRRCSARATAVTARRGRVCTARCQCPCSSACIASSASHSNASRRRSIAISNSIVRRFPTLTHASVRGGKPCHNILFRIMLTGFGVLY